MTSTPGEMATATAPTPIPGAPRQAGGRLPYAHERRRDPGYLGYGVPALAQERITFDAPCPGCGALAQWLQVREDTLVRSMISCGCP